MRRLGFEVSNFRCTKQKEKKNVRSQLADDILGLDLQNTRSRYLSRALLSLYGWVTTLRLLPLCMTVRWVLGGIVGIVGIWACNFRRAVLFSSSTVDRCYRVFYKQLYSVLGFTAAWARR